MWIEVLRGVNTALSDVTIGVNAQLLTLPIDGSDTRPDPISAIYDAASDKQAALHQLHDPHTLTILQNGDATSEHPMQSRRDSVFPISIVYHCEDVGSEQNVITTSYIMRAIHRTLSAWLVNTDPTLRIRNGVQFYEYEDTVEATIPVDPEQKLYITQLQVSLKARDQYA